MNGVLGSFLRDFRGVLREKTRYKVVVDLSDHENAFDLRQIYRKIVS